VDGKVTTGNKIELTGLTTDNSITYYYTITGSKATAPEYGDPTTGTQLQLEPDGTYKVDTSGYTGTIYVQVYIVDGTVIVGYGEFDIDIPDFPLVDATLTTVNSVDLELTINTTATSVYYYETDTSAGTPPAPGDPVPATALANQYSTPVTFTSPTAPFYVKVYEADSGTGDLIGYRVLPED